MMEVDSDHTPQQPVTVTDAARVAHTFEFRSMLGATRHALHAREVLPKGREGCKFSALRGLNCRCAAPRQVRGQRVDQMLMASTYKGRRRVPRRRPVAARYLQFLRSCHWSRHCGWNQRAAQTAFVASTKPKPLS